MSAEFGEELAGELWVVPKIQHEEERGDNHDPREP